MPTGNEYSAVTFGNSDQSYKQTDREMSPGQDFQIGGPMNPMPSGSYPRIFDREAGSEPLATGEAQNYYPDHAYDPIKCTGPGQSYVTTERESVSGEFTNCKEEFNLGKFTSGDDIVPDSVPSKQFSERSITYPGDSPKNAFGNNVLGSVKGV